MTDSLRWRDRKGVFRESERIDPSRYAVEEIHLDNVAKDFVLRHHYSTSYVAALRRFGLFRQGRLVGVAVFSRPISDGLLTNTFKRDKVEQLCELGRFVLLDEEPSNTETWFLARCRKLLIALGYRGVVSCSDPTPRTDRDGRTVFLGHVGVIYQGMSSVHVGRTKARTIQIFDDGTVANERSLCKIRALHRGWQGAVRKLAAHGADLRAAPHDGDRAGWRAWLKRELARITRPLRHPGNFKYAFPLAGQKLAGLPYPKRPL